MEEGPKIRVVGDVSEEEKSRIVDDTREKLIHHLDSLSDKDKEVLSKSEHPKTLEEVAVLDFVNSYTNKLMEEVGVRPYNIPIDNYHMISSDKYREIFTLKDSHAITFFRKQGIFFSAEKMRESGIFFASVALHETLHLKGHFSLMANEETSRSYREGVSVLHNMEEFGYKNRNARHFEGLHEAIVSETQKRALSDILNIPELKEEKDWFESEKARELRKKESKRRNISEDDILWVGEEEPYSRVVSYRIQREVLLYICDEIQKENSNKFKDVDDVFKLFLNAQFTGHLLEIGRLVERTFGSGSFRILGNMTKEPDSALLHLETFKKLRLKKTKR